MLSFLKLSKIDSGRCAIFLAVLLQPQVAMAGSPGKTPQPTSGLGAASSVARDRIYVSAGWMWRETGGASFDSGSRSPHKSLPRLTNSPYTRLPSIGAEGVYGRRSYQDGYVRMDEGTEFDGTTSAWGYQETSQVSGDAISFHATGHRRTVSSGQAARDPEDFSFDGSGGAPFIELGWEREISRKWSLGARLQWSFLNREGTSRQSTFSAWQEGRDYSISFTDTYQLRGVIPPAAPYEGAGLGFGPLIDNIPASRQRRESIAGHNTARFYNEIEQSFALDLHTLSLGPAATGVMGSLRWHGGLGLALNLVDWKAEQVETLFYRRQGGMPRVYRRWTERRDGLGILPGFYLQGGVSWQITDRIFVSGFGRYDWSRKLEEQLGPTKFSFDPGGWSAGAGVGFTF